VCTEGQVGSDRELHHSGPGRPGTNALNGALGTSLTKEFFPALGQETLKLEHEFNRRAGFTEKDDELPAFFYNEPLAPTNHVARFHGQDVHGMYERLPA